ncbi:hypothetical protein V494_06618 [Pseudogymnoascus sp. VKM F-4513 (FW-928)]|nr:hypothetical protein V494_06618 [Pseudogymnoascus sp. VKM F-4513 (FW-928)]
MEDPPPPYPGPNAPLQSQQPISVSVIPLLDPDPAAFTYPHVMLISVIKSVDGLGATMVHYWTARSPSTSVTIYSQLGINSFQHVGDFRELGTFTLPSGVEASDVHQCLTSLISECPTISSDEELIPSIITQLSSLPQNKGLSVQLFSMPVFGSSAEGLLPGGPIPTWKWSKPASLYGQKTGSWEIELGKAIEDGEWTAGKDLQILVKGISEESADDLRKSRAKFRMRR